MVVERGAWSVERGSCGITVCLITSEHGANEMSGLDVENWLL